MKPEVLRRPEFRGIATLATVVALGLAACGDREDYNTDKPTKSVAPTTSTDESHSPELSDNSTSGRFEATPGDGYTVEVSYDLSNIDGQIDIAGAKPGQAIVYGSASGDVTVTNTTSQRNIDVKLPQFKTALLWGKSQIDGDLLPNLVEPDDICEFSFRGTDYCNLANIYFEFANERDYFYNDPTTIGSDQSLSMATEEPKNSPGRSRPYGSLVVREDDADKLSQFISSTPPDLLAVYGGVSGPNELRMSCAIEVISAETQPIALKGPLAILNGKGKPLIEGGKVDQYEKNPPMCADA